MLTTYIETIRNNIYICISLITKHQPKNMKTLNFIYNGKHVDFELTVQENVMVNATQMAKIFNKQVVAFLRNDDTKNFILECLKSDNSHFLNIEKEEDLVTSTQKTGTWMHRVLALKFAAWLDPAFDLWVYITIDKILNQHFRAQREAMVQKVSIRQKKEILKNELLDKYPETKAYFDLEIKEKEADSMRSKAIREQLKEIQMEFNFENIN